MVGILVNYEEFECKFGVSIGVVEGSGEELLLEELFNWVDYVF